MAKGASGRQISGIFVPIQLDTQYITSDIAALKTQLGTMGAAMGASIDRALNPKNLMKNFKTLIESVGNIRDSITALNRLEPFGNFQTALNWITPEMKELAQTLGITTQAQRQLLEAMAKNTAIQQQVTGLRQLERTLGLTRVEAIKMAESLGMVIDKAARLQYMGSQGNVGILERLFGKNASSTISGTLGALGVAGGAYGFVEMSKGMIETAMRIDNLKTAFEAIYGSSERAGQQLEFVKNVSNQLGLSFLGSSENAKKFFAAMQGTQIEQDANKIFLAFSNAGAALKLTKDEMNSVFLALSQMASKGKIQAEELRSQLAERFPGAVSLFAKSIGVSTVELDNMLQKGVVGLEHLSQFASEVQRTYAAGAALASHSLQAELNRLENAWTSLSTAFINTDELANGVRLLTGALQLLVDNAGGIKRVGFAFAEVTVAVLAARGVVTIITSIVTAMQTLGGAAALASAGFARLGAAISAFLGPAGVVAAVLATLGIVVYESMTNISEAEKVWRKYESATDKAKKSIDDVNKSMANMSEFARNTKLTALENEVAKAKSDIDLLFAPQQVPDYVLGWGGIETQGISKIEESLQGMQSAFRGEKARQLYDEAKNFVNAFYSRLNSAFIDNKSTKEFEQILEDYRNKMQDIKNRMFTLKIADDTQQGFEKFSNILDVAGQNFLTLKAKQEQFATSAKATTDIVAKANAAFDTIAKLGKSSPFGKESGALDDIDKMVGGLSDIKASSDDAQAKLQEMGSRTKENAKDWDEASKQVNQFDKAIVLVASAALSSGLNFQELSARLDLVGQAASWAKEDIEKLRVLLQSGMSLTLVDSMDKAIEKIQTNTELIGKNKGVSQAFNAMNQGLQGLLKGAVATDAIMAIQQKDAQKLAEIWKGVGYKSENLNKEAEAFIKYQTALENEAESRSRARSSSRTRIMSSELKEIEALKKKIADFQSSLEHDPSLKYIADVSAELVKINSVLENGKGTAAEKQRLRELSEEYKRYAMLRYNQMAEDEKRQKQISALQMFSKRGKQLGEVDPKVDPSVQINALNAQYAIAHEALVRFVKDGTITWEQYYDQIAILNEELKMKTEAANGSIIANLGLKFEESYQSVMNWQQQISKTVVSGVNSMSDAFADFFIKGMRNTDDLAKAFSDMVSNMISDLARLFMRMMVMSAASKIFSSFFGGGRITGGFGGMDSYEASNPWNAKGGVYAGGGIRGIGSYSNSVVTRPTAFSFSSHLTPFARGGIMGEAGPEAIMPLVRTRNGSLGVRAEEASSGISQVINVNVVNNSDSQIKTRQNTDSSGNIDIEVMIDKAVAKNIGSPGSSSYRAMQGTFGAQPVLANR